MSRDVTPNLTEVLRSAITAALGRVRVSMPGRIESYDHATQKADVQPLIQDGYLDESGARVAESLPVVPAVPVMFPGTGGFSDTWPLERGDTVLLVWSSSSLDKWLATGGLVDPRDDRRHALPDAVAYPGLRPFTSPVGSDGIHDSARVLAGSEIRIGGSSGVQPTFMADAFMAAFTALVTSISSAVGTIPSGGGAASTISAALTTFRNTINSNGKTSIVKVK